MISQQQRRKKCFHQVAAASDRYHSIDALHQVARVPRLMQQACQMPALAEILVLQGVLAGLGWAGLGWAGLGWAGLALLASPERPPRFSRAPRRQEEAQNIETRLQRNGIFEKGLWGTTSRDTTFL